MHLRKPVRPGASKHQEGGTKPEEEEEEERKGEGELFTGLAYWLEGHRSLELPAVSYTRLLLSDTALSRQVPVARVERISSIGVVL